MAYEPFECDINDMQLVAAKHNGNIKEIAKHFNVHRYTIYRYLDKNPEAKKVIAQVRHYNTDDDLDLAEQVIRLMMTKHDTAPGLALKAAEKVIDLKGHSRGWHKTDKDTMGESVATKQDEIMQFLKQSQSPSERKIPDTNTINE